MSLKSHRFRFDWETTLPLKVFVRAAECELVNAWDAFGSIRALVCAFVLDCRRAEPAKDFCRALDEGLLSVLAAFVATRGDVCFVFAMEWLHIPQRDQGNDRHR